MQARQFSNDAEYSETVARSKPRSLVAVETIDGESIYAFPIGTRRPESDELHFASRFQFQDTEGMLVLQMADESRLEIDSAVVRRIYAPNQLTLAQRVQLTVVRISEARWRSEGADSVQAAMPEQGDEQTVEP